MGPYKYCVSQTRKPKGFLGKIMIKGMNAGHTKLAGWGLSHLRTIVPEEIVDIGCGGGKNAGELLKKYPGSRVTAIDYSPLSVAQASKYNKRAITAGRCVVKQGDVSALTLEEGKYSLATAFETVYFWPGLEKCFREAARVLKPGGVFMIVNESDGKDATGVKFEQVIDGMKVYTAEQIAEALMTAGFLSVKAFHHKSKPWITVLARK